MACGLFDDYEPDLDVDPLDDEARWVTIHVHSRANAIAEGVLIPYQFEYDTKTIDCCFSDQLYHKYRKSPATLKFLAQTGMRLLKEPDPEDTPYLKRRVILKNQVWVIADREGITFLQPDDY